MKQLVVDHEDGAQWTLNELKGQNDDKTTMRSFKSHISKTSVTSKAMSLASKKSILEQMKPIQANTAELSPLRQNLSALNANKGKKGISNKNDYFLLNED